MRACVRLSLSLWVLFLLREIRSGVVMGLSWVVRCFPFVLRP